MGMKNGMINCLITAVFLLVPITLYAQGEIYKVVDKDGNVTFTDQRPSAEAQPVDLPPLSVIETDIQTPAPPPQTAQSVAGESEAPTPRDLRKQYRDFRIVRPLQEETFWGTENAVVVTWASTQAIDPSMSVMVFVDGKPQKAPASGAVSLNLERGEHQVYAELRDERNRRIVTTETITFFVKQWSQNFNRPAISPRNR
jgi:hypothetical protein